MRKEGARNEGALGPEMFSHSIDRFSILTNSIVFIWVFIGTLSKFLISFSFI